MSLAVTLLAIFGPSVGFVAGAWWASRDKPAIYTRGWHVGRSVGQAEARDWMARTEALITDAEAA